MKTEQINLIIAISRQNRTVDLMAKAIKDQLHKLLSEMDEVHVKDEEKKLLNEAANLLSIIQSRCTAYQTEKEVIKYLQELETTAP